MQAVVQDAYGSPRCCGWPRAAVPEIGDDEVLIRVHAAGVHLGDWHVMTGPPYLMRVMGFGFRAPKNRVPGIDVAGTVEAVGAEGDPASRSATRCSASATARSPSTPPPGRTSSRSSRPASPSSRLPRCRSRPARRSRRCATPGDRRQGRSSWSTARPAASGCSRCRSPRRRRRGDRRVQRGRRRTWSAPSAPTTSSTTPRTSPPTGNATT